MNDPADTIDRLRREVVARHGASPGCVRVVRAPYRVCPLGAHVDHQLGPVTAMAIDRGVYLAYAPSGSGEVVVSSLDFPGVVRFDLGDVPGRRGDDWGNFPRGAARALSGRYPLGRGLVGVTAGRLHGGGVSSSAAVGVSFLLALEDVNGLPVPAAENIELDRRIETDYLGLRIGILDPAAILLSRRGHLTRIDCRTAAHELIPAVPGLPPWRILLAFSGLRRALAETDYNRRVAECAEAARTLLAALGREGGEPVLGDVAPDEYLAHRHLLRGAPARRAVHFFSEVERVRRGVEAWRAGDLAGFGALMTASGASSIHNYECGSPPLIDLYQTLIATEGVHGARFSGAGFGGCCVALVDPRAVDQAADHVGSIYRRMHPDLAEHAQIVACDSDDGAALVDAEPGEPRPRTLVAPAALAWPPSPARADLPRSIAIAGAWGYIGRKFLDVALARGLTAHVYDPGPLPGDLDPGRFHWVADEADFYRLDAEFFHLATHPEHRRLDLLLGRGEPLVVLDEKPMALPEHPEDCRRIIEAVERSPAIVLYDFPELYDPLTARVVDHLSGFKDVRLTEVFVRRSKDREDPAIPRNYKRMVPIQYQESVHCLAFVLHVLAAVRGGAVAALADGIRLEARSVPYEPPNPEAYPHVVDGRCRFRAVLGDVRIEGLTDFKRGVEWAKRRIIRGIGDGRPFEIEISFLEGRKWLRIDGQDQPCDPSASSYENVLATATRWARRVGRDGLMTGLYPNPRFTHLTYQLSAALWRAAREPSGLRFDSAAELVSWDAGFAPGVSPTCTSWR